MRAIRNLLFLMVAVVLSCQSWGKFWDVTPVISINNLKQNGELWTNMLFGTATLSPQRVEISIAGGAYAEVSGTSQWRYVIPRSANLKIGKKYILSIRTTSSAGTTSVNLIQTLTKRQNQDINGDGFADLAVGGEQYASYQGGVWIYYGSAAGIASQAAALPTVTSGAAEYFGGALAIGDANGDGLDDPAVR